MHFPAIGHTKNESEFFRFECLDLWTILGFSSSNSWFDRMRFASGVARYCKIWPWRTVPRCHPFWSQGFKLRTCYINFAVEAECFRCYVAAEVRLRPTRRPSMVEQTLFTCCVTFPRFDDVFFKKESSSPSVSILNWSFAAILLHCQFMSVCHDSHFLHFSSTGSSRLLLKPKRWDRFHPLTRCHSVCANWSQLKPLVCVDDSWIGEADFPKSERTKPWLHYESLRGQTYPSGLGQFGNLHWRWTHHLAETCDDAGGFGPRYQDLTHAEAQRLQAGMKIWGLQEMTNTYSATLS